MENARIGEVFQYVEKSFEEVDNGKLIQEPDASALKLVNQIISEPLFADAPISEMLPSGIGSSL